MNTMFPIISYIIVVASAIGFTKLIGLINGITNIFSDTGISETFIFETVNYSILIIIALVIGFKSASEGSDDGEDNSKKSFIEMLGGLFEQIKTSMSNPDTPITNKIILVGTNVVFIVGFYLMMFLILKNLSVGIASTGGEEALKLSSFLSVIGYYVIFGITAWAFIYVFSSVFSLLEKIANEIGESGINKFYTKILLAFFSLIGILVIYANVSTQYSQWAKNLSSNIETTIEKAGSIEFKK